MNLSEIYKIIIIYLFVFILGFFIFNYTNKQKDLYIDNLIKQKEETLIKKQI